MGAFCEFANNQLAEDDLNLRTLQIAAGTAIESDPTDVTDGLVESAAASDNSTPKASCSSRDVSGTDANDLTQEEGYADILAYDGTATIAVLGTTSLATPAKAPAHFTGATGEQIFADELDSVGLRSTKTVWMAMFGTGAAVPNFAPAGVDTTFDPDNTSVSQRGVEYLVFGGLAPDGHSFCLLKVFDASDANHIGEYRVSRLPQANNAFAVCSLGTEVSGLNKTEHGGDWPEPR